MNRKITLSTLALALGAMTAQAQISQGGLPLSLQNGQTVLTQTITAANPDWNAYLTKEKSITENNFNAPYLAALMTPTNIGFPNSGSFTTLEDGTIVWRTQLNIEGAPAIGLYYDLFQLPKGVSLYLSNGNQQQILGAFTAQNNDASKQFSTDAIQGGVVNIEMNIDPSTNLNDIQFHINQAAVYHRAIEHLNFFATENVQTIDAYDNALLGASSVCGINSICDQGSNYEISRRATAQYLYVNSNNSGVGLCSGTMVNNTTNTTANCKPYFLTAAHCDGANSTSNTHFSQLLVRFNFEHRSCNPSAVVRPTSNTMNGANFVARASYSASQPANSIKGDFLLLELRSAIPASWNVKYAGWNKNANIATSVAAPQKFIGFHHPAGDSKKLSTSQSIMNGSVGAQGSHWLQMVSEGYVAGGSSGSALFDGEGRVIGIASIAGATNAVPNSCKLNAHGDTVQALNRVYYSKLSYGWNYTVDGNAATSQLQPWLDPSNSATTINPVNSDCSAISTTSITNVDANLDRSIAIYPNPSQDGMVKVQMNFVEPTDLYVQVIDVTGAVKKSVNIATVTNSNVEINLSTLPSGMYMIKFNTSSNAQTTKKLMITK